MRAGMEIRELPGTQVSLEAHIVDRVVEILEREFGAEEPTAYVPANGTPDREGFVDVLYLDHTTDHAVKITVMPDGTVQNYALDTGEVL